MTDPRITDLVAAHDERTLAEMYLRLTVLLEAHRTEYLGVCRDFLDLRAGDANQALADFEREALAEVER